MTVSNSRSGPWVPISANGNQVHHHHHHHHQSLNHEGHWGTTDDFATSFLHFSLFSTALWDLPNSRPVHSLMLSSYLFLCLPCLLPPFTMPCNMVLARPDEFEQDHTTAVCVSLPLSGGFRVVRLPAGSWHGKIRLIHSLVTSIFLSACESWAFTAELQRRIQAMEMRCSRTILRISYKDPVTNEEVCAKIQQAIGPHKDLLTIVKRRKMQWYSHVSRSSGLAKTILQGTV